MILFSNLGHSHISQAPSALEKHYTEEMTCKPIGVVELEEDRAENQTFVNKFMRYLHS